MSVKVLLTSSSFITVDRVFPGRQAHMQGPLVQPLLQYQVSVAVHHPADLTAFLEAVRQCEALPRGGTAAHVLGPDEWRDGLLLPQYDYEMFSTFY